MNCKRCRERGKTWTGADARCAFESGVFDASNWNCATMNDLRELADDVFVGHHVVCSDDQRAGMVPIGSTGRFIVLGWYKSRGATEYAGVLSESAMGPLTLGDAEAALEAAP